MSDVIVIVGLVAGFVLLALFVNLCDRTIGPDPSGLDDDESVLDELDHAAAEREAHRRALIDYAEHHKAEVDHHHDPRHDHSHDRAPTGGAR